MGLSILDHLLTLIAACGASVIEYGSRRWSEGTFDKPFQGLYEDCSLQETDFEPLLGTFVENDNCHT